MAKDVDQILREGLLKKNVVSEDELNTLFKEIAATKESLVAALARKKLVSRKKSFEILSEEYGLAFIDLKRYPVQKEAIEKVPTRFAFYYNFIPLKIKSGILTVAVSKPLDIKTQDEIRTHLGFAVEMVLAFEEEIVEALKKYYGLGADTLQQITPGTQEAEAQERIADIEMVAEDASVIKLVNQILLEAYKKRATDIHIEPYRGEVSIRYRIDGVLYDANVPKEIKPFILPVISRIKILSNLNIVEKRIPQDGRAVVKTQEQTLDLRISTLPTPYGESVVIRILPTKMLFDMGKLGLSRRDRGILEGLIGKPHGIIFITGPTGSGKTTTLYACLNQLNTRDRKIITIEDPIEYELKGVTQIQVMPEIGLSFAKGLRSILRHDPDIIMVGEVRDLETAEIATRVALTGHLVFSTLHTNDAPSGITRLVDIGVEPYLVSSIVEAFIAQRLVRVICPSCKQEDTDIPQAVKEKIAREFELTLDGVTIYKANGCDACNGTGFAGRTGIYEVLLVDEEIKDLIVRRLPSDEIKKVAIQRGMYTLRQDGWQKVIQGITIPSEVMRVVSSEEYQGQLPDETGAKGVSIDNRRYSRLNTSVNVRYIVIKSKDELIKRGYASENFSTSCNIGAGGIAFAAGEAIPVGSMLELTLELPDTEKPIVCLAKVVWAKELESDKGCTIGVCFLDLTGSERARIKAFVFEELEA